MINQESLFFEAVSWKKILGHYLKDLYDLLTLFDILNTGGNLRGEAWRFEELCGEFCEELETSFTLKTFESLISS